MELDVIVKELTEQAEMLRKKHPKMTVECILICDALRRHAERPY